MLLFVTLMAAAAVAVAVAMPRAHLSVVDDNQIQKYPYQASIERLGSHTCGGAIISPKHIITAAECVAVYDGIIEYSVRVGTSQVGTSGEVHAAENLQVHPEFRVGSVRWNVAVITLKDEINMSDTIKAIVIKKQAQEPQKGEMLRLTGWGHTQVNASGEQFDILQGVNVPVMSRDKCATTYYELEITEDILCAGGFIVGDLGGPLVNDANELVGVLSWISTGKPNDNPGLYANIAYPGIRDFILQNIKYNNEPKFRKRNSSRTDYAPSNT